jgi:chromosome segregation ATPase
LELEVYNLRAELHAQKDTFQEEIEGLREVIRNQGLRINTELRKVRERLNRHRSDINFLRRKVTTSEEEVGDLESKVVILCAQVASMEGRLCQCGEGSPIWSG